jgi:hypothetical protein
MMVYSNQSYEDQDDGRILKAARKQTYIMFPAPIAFLNNELKSELGMKSKKEEKEDDEKFCSLKVPMDHESVLNYSHSRNPRCVPERTHARTNTSAQRATHIRSVLARVYAVSRQNQITTAVP